MRRLDVRKVREDLGMTQATFAERFGFPIGTLRHWEQGQRSPAGPARTLLIVIERAPKVVMEALQSSRSAA
jgi:putative transcriptional regulator